MRYDGGWIAVALLAAGCAPWGPPAVPDDLMAADRAFAEATAARGADGWADWFGEDGRMYRARGYVNGRAAIRDAMAPTFEEGSSRLRWEPDTAFVAASGELGYTLGHWEAVVTTAAGDSVAGRGNYVTIWRRQRDGSWKVAVDIGNQGS